MVEGFIVYPTYRVEKGKSFIYLFGRLKDGRSFCTKNEYRAYFYVKKNDLKKALGLKVFEYEKEDMKTFKNEEVVKVYTDLPGDVPEYRKLFEENNIDCYEADIRFAYRYLMDNNIKGSVSIEGEESKTNLNVDVFFNEPKLKNSGYKPGYDDLKLLSIDIETSKDHKRLYCISLKSNDDKVSEVLVNKKGSWNYGEGYSSEKELLKSFKEKITHYNPDVITGWNVIDFDLKILKELFEKNGLKFNLGRLDEECSLTIQSSFFRDSKADFKGVMVLDGIHVLKGSFIQLEDYKLDTAAKSFSKKDKLITENKSVEIDKAFKEDIQKLVDYNLVDSELVLDILKNSGVLELTVLRSLLTGMAMDRVNASIASFDFLYLSKLNKLGYVAPSITYKERSSKTTGGYVMATKPGIYDYIAVFDFKSLYPSIMITFNIDPLKLRSDCKPLEDEELLKAPNDVCFSKEKGLLTNILKELWIERGKATKKGDLITRQAIKILMNSMYGVLASPNCRFYSFEMANAITSFGHMMIKNTAKILDRKGFKTIYGDTDSVFVDLNSTSEKDAVKKAKTIEKEINDYYKNKISEDYGMESHLELEFEKLYKKFFLPKVRGSEEGAKKRYAGWLLKDGNVKMDFTGLEFVRRDWTEVSKKFQLELLEKAFKNEDVEDYIRKFVENLKNGEYDEMLVYKKAIRKELKEYTKTTPPHVKAARQLDSLDSNIISYVITKEGPEPIQKLKNSIDYEHYIDKQIKPIADSILYFKNKNFNDLFNEGQRTLGSF